MFLQILVIFFGHLYLSNHQILKLDHHNKFEDPIPIVGIDTDAIILDKEE